MFKYNKKYMNKKLARKIDNVGYDMNNGFYPNSIIIKYSMLNNIVLARNIFNSKYYYDYYRYYYFYIYVSILYERQINKKSK